MIWLFVIFQIIFIHINWWAYNAYYVQPQYNHPVIFWNPLARKLLLTLPWIGIIGLVVSAFFFTDRPWLFLFLTAAWWLLMGYRGYKAIKVNDPEKIPPITTEKFHGKNSIQNSETSNQKVQSDKSSEPKAERAICIKCGNFKAAALGRCSSCNFAPETSLDAAKSVIFRIESFPRETLLNISRDIKEKGIGSVSFAGAPLKDFIDTVEDVGKGKNTRVILEMNKHQTDQQGPALTQTILGWRYHQGEGVAQDYCKAAEFWRKASDLGNTDAHYNLSRLYAQGNGVSQDYPKAIALLTLAAEQGHSGAQKALGLLFIAGNGVNKDYSKGIMWLTKAATQGNKEAENLLKELHELDAQENNSMKPDYGLNLIKNGLEKETEHYFYGLKIDHLNRLDKTTLTTVANTVSNGETYAVSFDIPAHLFNDLLEQFPEPTQSDVRIWLNDGEEWCYEFNAPQSLKVVKATLGDLQTSTVGSKEKFIPLVVQSFGIKTDATYEVGNRVFHGKFGYGEIINIDGEKLDIDFEQNGKKRVMGNFVELAE